MSYYIALPDGTYVEMPDNAPNELVEGVRNKITERFPDLAPKQSAFRQVADIPLQVAKGALGSVGSISDAFGANNVVSRGLNTAEDYVSTFLSAQSRKDSAEMARIMDEAKDKGFGDQLIAAGKAFAVAPLDLAAQGIGSFAVPMGVGTLSKAAKLGSAASRVASGVTGAGMGAGSVKSAIYDETKKVLTEQGKLSPEEIETAAQQAQAYNGKNLDQILLGAGLGAADVMTGVDKIFTGVQAAEKAAGHGLVGRAVRGFAGEAPLEALQGGQELYAANTAVGREGFERDPWQGVVAKGALEGLVGGATGSTVDIALGKRPGAPTTEKEAGTTDLGQKELDQTTRDEYELALKDLGYTDEQIAKVPTEDLRKIASGAMTPDQYFASKATAEEDNQKPKELGGPTPDFIGPAEQQGPKPDFVGPPPPEQQGPQELVGPRKPEMQGPPEFVGPPAPEKYGPPELVGPRKPEMQGPPEVQGPKPDFVGPPEMQGPKRSEVQGPPEMQGPKRDFVGPPEMQGPSKPEVQGPPEMQGPKRDFVGPPEMQGPTKPEVQGPPEMQGPKKPEVQNPPEMQGPPKPVAPLPKPAPSPTPPSTRFNIDDVSNTSLETKIPGVVDVLREIHKRLFPGTSLRVTDKDLQSENALGQSRVYIGTNMFDLEVDSAGIARYMPASPTGQKQYLLKTLFHEMAHPIQYSWLMQASDATFMDVVKQYVKTRNPSALERYSLVRHLAFSLKKNDPKFIKKLLYGSGLTESDIEFFQKNPNRISIIPGLSSDNYMRNFNEWIAEQGARWMTKNLKGLVPQTTFEKFQKRVLDGLRKVYVEVSKALGIKPTEGAFEKLLNEIYGNEQSTPMFKNIVAEGRSNLNPKYKDLLLQETGNQTRVPQEGPETVVNRSAAPSSAPAAKPAPARKETPYEKKVRLEAEKLPPGMREVFKRVVSVNDETPGGIFKRAAIAISGAVKGESIGRALIRNGVVSNLPFLERADLRNLGQMLESLQNSTGRVMGLVDIGSLTYNPVTKKLEYKAGSSPLAKIFEKIGTEKMNEMRLVMLAQRVLALRAAGRVNSTGDVGIGIPMTNDEARRIIRLASPEVLEASREFQKFNNDMVEFAIQTGLIPRSLGENFKSLMYTPMFRAQDEDLAKTPNIGIGQSIYDAIKDPESITAFNKRVGGDGQVDMDLYENILRNYNAIVSAGLRNIAYQETSDALTKIVKDGGDTTIAEVVSKPGTDPLTGESTITYRVGGEDRHMLIHDPAMFQAIASLTPDQKTAFVRAMGKLTALLRRGVTATPPFQLRNLFRGLVELKIKTGMSSFETVKGTLDAVQEVWNKEGAYKDILAQTGFGGFGFGSSYRDQASFMKRGMVAKEQPLNPWNSFLRLFDKLEEIGEVTEMAPRIAYYRNLQKRMREGKREFSDGEAAWEAVNLVNYHRHGAGNGIAGNVISNMIPLTPFLTARIQGLYRLTETGLAGTSSVAGFKLPKETLVGIPLAIASRGMMVMAINAALNAIQGDDDWYKRLPVKDRLSNMYVRVGDTVLALPRAYEVGELFGGIPTLMMDSIRQKNGNDVAAGVGAFLANTFVVNPIPQFAKPLIEVLANMNFYTHQPIETLSDKNRPKEERANEYTSSLGKLAGQVSKAGTAVPIVGEALQISPKQFDSLLRGYLGTTATLFLGTVDALVSTGGTRPQGIFGDPASLTGVAGNLTGLASIMKAEDQLNNKYVGDFYEIKDKVTQIVNSMNDAARAGDISIVEARIKEMPQAKNLFTAFNAAAANLSQINRHMTDIQRSSNFTPDQKVGMLERLHKARATITEQMVTAAERAGVTR